MAKWRCTVCNYVYDEEKEGTTFQDLPLGWVCPVKVVVFNDSKIKNIAKEQALYGYPSYGISFPNPDFAAFARSCGGEGYRCGTPDELDEALAKGMDTGNPVIFDVVVDPEKMAPLVKIGGEH